MKWAVWTWIWFALMVVGCVHYRNDQALYIWVFAAALSFGNAIVATMNTD
jgi:hypothetical protein